MKALVLEAVQQPLEWKEIAKPQAGDQEVIVKIAAAALNHRDVYITQGLYPKIAFPVILGSDGVGTVVEVGSGVDHAWLDQKVILNPNIGWGDSERVQDKNYHILGMPTHGTLAQYVRVKADRIALSPDHLTDEQAASLPLAGLTAYRSLCTRAQVHAGERVLISGVGGGVALFALQFAVALGAEVYVTSGDEAKIQQAIQLGAKGGVNYKNEQWHKELAAMAGGGFDAVVDGAGGEGFSRFLDLANPAGRIVFYGGTRGNFTVNPQKVFWKQLSLLGSTMGSDADFTKMLHLVRQAHLVPVVDSVWSMTDGNAAFQRMNEGKQFGKIVLKPAF